MNLRHPTATIGALHAPRAAWEPLTRGYPATAVSESARIDPPFLVLAAYLLAQAYTVPLVAIGPWAAWARAADFVFLAMPVAMLLYPGSFRARTGAHRTAFHWFVVWIGLCAVSYVVLVVLRPVLHPGLTGKGVSWGGFEVARHVQFAVVFWFVAGLDLNERQRRWIGRILAFVFAVVSLSVMATHSGVISTAVFGGHLPTDPDVSGPWSHFAMGAGRTRGGGTIGYNHAYPALQLLLLTGALFHFAAPKKRWVTGLVLLAGLAASVSTGSRTGLIAYLVLAALILLRNPTGVVVAIIVGIIAGGLLLKSGLVEAEPLRAALARVGTITTPQSTDAFSGRGDIWADRLQFLNESPLRWVVGGGFGSAIESGSQAHNQFLQTTIETGLIGLAVQLSFLAVAVRLLALRNGVTSVLVLLHLALLPACMAQEVFYPLPKLGHFLGFYVTVLALGLKRPVEREEVVDGLHREQATPNAFPRAAGGVVAPANIR